MSRWLLSSKSPRSQILPAWTDQLIPCDCAMVLGRLQEQHRPFSVFSLGHSGFMECRGFWFRLDDLGHHVRRCFGRIGWPSEVSPRNSIKNIKEDGTYCILEHIMAVRNSASSTKAWVRLISRKRGNPYMFGQEDPPLLTHCQLCRFLHKSPRTRLHTHGVDAPRDHRRSPRSTEKNFGRFSPPVHKVLCGGSFLLQYVHLHLMSLQLPCPSRVRVCAGE